MQRNPAIEQNKVLPGERNVQWMVGFKHSTTWERWRWQHTTEDKWSVWPVLHWGCNSSKSVRLLEVIITLQRSSAFTGCGFESGSSTSSLSWRTKCYMEVHQVTSGHLSSSPMCLVVEHSAPPARIASWCRQSRPPPSAVEPFRLLPH